jgi:hypothetical protein
MARSGTMGGDFTIGFAPRRVSRPLRRQELPDARAASLYWHQNWPRHGSWDFLPTEICEVNAFDVRCFDKLGPVAQRLEQRTHNLHSRFSALSRKGVRVLAIR